MASALRQNYVIGDDIVYKIQSNARVAQQFTPDITHDIDQVDLYLTKANTPTGTVTLEILAVDGDGKPTGSVLATGSKAVTAIAAGPAWVVFTLGAAYTLIANTQYAIVIYGPTGDASNYIGWRADQNDGAYAGGSVVSSANAGSTWTVIAANDCLFKEYGGFSVSGAVPVDKTFSKYLVSIANNEVWWESSVGTKAELTAANGDIDITKPLQMFELLEKVFIVNGTNLKVADFGNTKIVTTNVGSHPPDFNTVLTGGSGAKMIVDYVTSVTASAACTIYGKRITVTTFTASDTIGGKDDDGNTISFTMTAVAEVAPPHWYDWTVYGNSTTFGAMPAQANEGCNYRGRANLTADKDYPHQWYQSRQKNPWDWNYIANDAQSPIKGNDADAGEVGDIMVVSIPYKDDYLIHACANTLWYMVGDAAEGGSIVELDLTNGILGPRAWCWDNKDNLYILGTTGILKIPKGFGQIENLTALSWPDFINDLAYNSATHRIVMGYDRIRNGLKISKVTLADGTNSCWWYDFKAEGLFPESYPEECGTYCMFYYESVDPTYSGLLEGCFDGYIRQLVDAAVDDDIGDTDEAIDSYYTLGPIRMGPETKEGVFTSLLGIPAGGRTSGSLTNSSDIDWSLWTAETSDELVEKLLANTSPKIAGTMVALGSIRGARKRRDIRGMWMGIRLGNNTAAETWSLERLQVNIKAGGRLK